MEDIEVFYDSYSDKSSTKGNHLKFQGDLDCLSFGQQERSLPPKSVFVTLNFGTKQKFTLNKNSGRKEWQHFQTREQWLIMKRARHYFDTICNEYEQYFELTRNGDLHSHVILFNIQTSDKDLRIGLGRFFSIDPQHYRVAVDIRLVEDLDNLRNYLTNKDVKKYQVSGFPPIIKKPIDEFN